MASRGRRAPTKMSAPTSFAPAPAKPRPMAVAAGPVAEAAMTAADAAKPTVVTRGRHFCWLLCGYGDVASASLREITPVTGYDCRVEAAPEMRTLESGTMLDDKYRIERLLAVGGMGAVYEGTHTQLRKRVAIKILNPQLASKAMLDRFHREAITASQI